MYGRQVREIECMDSDYIKQSVFFPVSFSLKLSSVRCILLVLSFPVPHIPLVLLVPVPHLHQVHMMLSKKESQCKVKVKSYEVKV